MSKQSLLKIALIFLFSIGLSIALQRIFHFGITDIQNFVEGAGPWAPVAYGIILLLGLTIPFNPVPDTLTVGIAALIFPSWVAILMTFLAHSASLVINYWVARLWGDDLLRFILSKEDEEKIEALGPKVKPIWIFGARFLLPINGFGFDVISYASGIAKVPFREFFIASIIPWTILNIAYFSSAGYLRSINPALVALPAVFLIVIPIGLVVLFKKQKAKKKGQP